MEDPPRNKFYDVRYCIRAHELMDKNGPVAEALREYFIFLVKEKIGEYCKPVGKKGEKIGPIEVKWRNKTKCKSLTTWIDLYPEQKKICKSGESDVDDWDVQLLIRVIKAVLDCNCQASVEKKQKSRIEDHLENLRDDRNIAAHGDWARKTFKKIVQETVDAIESLLSDSKSARRQEILEWVEDVKRGVRYVLDDAPLREYRRELKNKVMAHVKAKGIAFEDSVSKCFPNSSDENDAHVTLFDSIDGSSMDEKDAGFARFIEKIRCEKKVQDIDKRYRDKKAELKEVRTVQLKLKKDHQNPPITWATMHIDITNFLRKKLKDDENPRIELISVKRGCIELIFTMSPMAALSLPSILVEPGETRELADLMTRIGNPMVTLFECLQFTPKDRRYEPTFQGTKYMQEDLLDLYREWEDKLKSQSADPKLLDNLKKSRDIVAELSPKMPEEDEEEMSEEPKKTIAGQKRVFRDTSPVEVSPPKKPKKKLPKTSKGMMTKKFEGKTTRTRYSKRRRRV